MPKQEQYDAVIVGSGAGGGMAAFVLATKGLRVLMLEAGRHYDPYKESAMFAVNRDAPLRGEGTPDKEFGFYDATVDGGWQVPGEPYTSAPGSEFMWWRSRMLGGRTNHWARNSFRMGPYDFKPRSRDGLGVDWPIAYEDIAPWYDKTETLIGVYGRNDGLENHPDSSSGVLHKPPAPRVGELLIQAACRDMKIPCVPARRAVLTRPIDDRSACFYATGCGRGCSIGAAFQTTTSLLPMALATGNLTIVTDAMVYELRMNDNGKADGVAYIDKKTGKNKAANGRVVVLAASAGETARILLNSKNATFPDGAANSSGQVGRNLMDTVGAAMGAQFPVLENRPSYNEDGAKGLHLYIPFWLYKEQARGELDFPRGYHYELGADGRSEPSLGMGSLADFAGGYGRQLKEDVRRYYGSFLSFTCRGEMIPNAGSYCEIDPEGKDQWGIPTLRFHFKWSEHELNMVRHFQQTTKGIIERLGGTINWGDIPPEEAISTGGQIIHEVGTTRMGDDPATSVTNQYGQSWDINNLFVTDGGVFASKAHKNPTLTIMALAWRGSDYLAEQLGETRVVTGLSNRDQGDDGILRVDRRTTIKWMAATMAAACAGCSADRKHVGEEIPAAPQRKLLGAAARPNGIGYGTDPDLIKPVVPWARTMTEAQRRTAAALCDVILPEDERSPAASAVGVHEFIDEWVSAPYPEQQNDREVILAGLEWLERQSKERFGSSFTGAAEGDKSALLDTIAWPEKAAPELADQVEFFRRFRYLTVGAFYTTEKGIVDVGYIGNFAITGDYPGPSGEAMAHLAGVLEQLGLG